MWLIFCRLQRRNSVEILVPGGEGILGTRYRVLVLQTYAQLLVADLGRRTR